MTKRIEGTWQVRSQKAGVIRPPAQVAGIALALLALAAAGLSLPGSHPIRAAARRTHVSHAARHAGSPSRHGALRPAGATAKGHGTAPTARAVGQPAAPSYESILPKGSVLAYGSGFWGSQSAASFMAHAQDVTAYAPWGFALLASGGVVERGGGSVMRLVRWAHAHGRSVIPLFTNAWGNDTILQNPTIRAMALADIVRIVRTDDLDGVNIDFEELSQADEAPEVAFVSMLAARLHPLGRIVTVAVGPQWAGENPSWASYDYAGLGQVADRVVLMTYDEHSNPGQPGPIAALPWVERTVRYALTTIPRAKILLGLADYGYNWSGSQMPTVTATQAIQTADGLGVPIEWDSYAEEPYYTYTGPNGNTHAVWFEDGRSESFKIAIAKADQLGGVALWQLGGGGPASWQALSAYGAAQGTLAR